MEANLGNVIKLQYTHLSKKLFNLMYVLCKLYVNIS